MTVSPRTVDVGGAAPYRITIGPGLVFARQAARHAVARARSGLGKT